MNDARPRRRTRRRLVICLGIGMLLLLAGPLGLRGYVFWQGNRQLHAAEAELDAADPGWRQEALVAAQNAAVAEPDWRAGVLRRVEPLAPHDSSLDPSWGVGFDHLLHGDNRPLAPADTEQFGPYLTAVRPALDAATELNRHAPTGLRIDRRERDGDTTVQHLVLCKKLVLGSCLTALVCADAGRADDAGASIWMGTVVLETIGPTPDGHAQRSRLQWCVDLSRTTLRVLSLCEPREGLAECQAAFQSELEHPHSQIAIRADRAKVRELLLAVADGRVGTHEYLEAVGAKSSSRIEDLLYWFLKAHTPENATKLLTGYHAAIMDANRPLWERTAVEIECDLKDDRYAGVFGRGVSFFSRRSQLHEPYQKAVIAAAVGAVACERHRQRTGGWPSSLADIPVDLLPAQIRDPYTGGPMYLRRTDDGLLVYSLGPNKRDDGGTFPSDRTSLPQPTQPVDIGFRLWDPAHRRKTVPPATAS